MNESESEFAFSIFDLKILISRYKNSIALVVIISFFLSFSFFLLRVSPTYEASAIFYEAPNSEESPNMGLAQLLSSRSSGSAGQAFFLLRSSKIMEPVVKNLGLQISVGEKGRFHRICENILVEFKKPLSDIDDFEFKNVSYEREEPLSFYIKFLDKEKFLLLTSEGKELLTCKVNEEASFEDLSFTLIKIPKSLTLGKKYKLNICSLLGKAEELASSVTVVNEKSCSNFLRIKFKHRDKEKAKEILTQLMREEVAYLRRENDTFRKMQISYLESREEELKNKMEQTFTDYTTYLHGNLTHSGFMDLEHEIESLSGPGNEYLSRLVHIDIDASKLKNFLEDRSPKFAALRDFKLNDIAGELIKLKQEKDILDISMILKISPPDKSQNEMHKISFTKNQDFLLSRRFSELKEIRVSKADAQNLLNNMQNNSYFTSYKDIGNMHFVKTWIDRVARSNFYKSPDLEVEKNDFCTFLQNYIHLLNIKEKSLEEGVLEPIHIPVEFEGLDLDTAKQLYVEFEHELNRVQLSIRQMIYMADHIKESDFKFSSLSSILLDSISQNLINKASQLTLTLQDTKNVSLKEQDRIREDLSVQRNFFVQRLKEGIEFKKLDEELIVEKMKSLKEVILDRLNQKISLLQEQAVDQMRNLKTSLTSEKGIIEGRLKDLQVRMADLPKMWHQEKMLNFKTEMNLAFMKSLVQLIESKTISHNLSHIGSKPFSMPVASGTPLPLHISFYSLFFSIFAAFLCILFYLIKGLPVSLESLELLGEIVCGALASGLETLRRIQVFIDPDMNDERKLVTLIGNGGPDYSHKLAFLMAKRGKKVIVLDASFNNSDEKSSLQFLEKKKMSLPILTKEGYDFLSLGGKNDYSTEVLNSKVFLDLLFDLKKDYDTILVFNKSPIKCSEVLVFLKFSDKIIVTINNEKKKEFQPFIEWGQNKRRLSFVSIKE